MFGILRRLREHYPDLQLECIATGTDAIATLNGDDHRLTVYYDEAGPLSFFETYPRAAELTDPVVPKMIRRHAQALEYQYLFNTSPSSVSVTGLTCTDGVATFDMESPGVAARHREWLEVLGYVERFSSRTQLTTAGAVLLAEITDTDTETKAYQRVLSEALNSPKEQYRTQTLDS